MLRLSLYILLFIFSAYNCFAQKATIQKGESISKRIQISKIDSQNDSNIIAIGYKRNKYWVFDYDENLYLNSKNKVKMSHNGKKMDYVDFRSFENKLSLFTYFNNQSTQKAYFLYQQFDPKERKFGELKVLSETSNTDNGKLFFEESEDKSKEIIVHNYIPDKNSFAQAKVILLSENNKKTTKIVTFPYKDNSFKITKTHIANDGTVYLICKKFLKEKKEEDFYKYKVNYSFVLIKISDELATFENTEIVVENALVLLLDMYTLEKGKQGMMAISYIVKDDKVICNLNIIQLDEDLADYEIVDFKELSKWNLNYMTYGKIISVPTFKFSHIEIVEGQIHQVLFERKLGSSDDLIFVSIDKDEIEEIKHHFINLSSKSQVMFGRNKTYYYTKTPESNRSLNYSYYVIDSVGVLILNDHRKNWDNKNKNITHGFDGYLVNSVPALFRYKTDEEREREKIETNTKRKMMIFHNTSYQKENQIFLFGQIKRKAFPLKLTFQK